MQQLTKAQKIKGRRYVQEYQGQWYFTSWGCNWQWRETAESMALDNIKHGAKLIQSFTTLSEKRG